MAPYDRPVEQIDPAVILRRGTVRHGLWLCGAAPPPDRLRVGLIGSRSASPQQADMARELAAGLARAGAVVVSGGARGIDGEALAGAIMARGVAVAVLPSAQDRPYPPQHEPLFGQIVRAGGALVSGSPPGTEARTAHFLTRNLLMTRMIDALITVCANVHSGSLHCAGAAWQAGLPVLAVPWTPGSANSEGSNRLLAAGARAIWDADGCQRLLAALQDAKGNQLLARQVAAPGRPGRKAPAAPDHYASAPAVLARSIDAHREARPSYDAEAVTSRAVVDVPAGCDPALVRGLADALQDAGPSGLSLEELTQALGCARSEAARTALQLVLHGGIRRSPGGGFFL